MAAIDRPSLSRIRRTSTISRKASRAGGFDPFYILRDARLNQLIDPQLTILMILEYLKVAIFRNHTLRVSSMIQIGKVVCAFVLVSGLASNASAANVSRDSDGWVSVDGKTIGRVTFSYGDYRISCQRGYTSGRGGSFTIKANDRDEATAVLLRACKR